MRRGPTFTDTEQRAHFSLWAMLAALLLAGNDVRTMTQATREILTNREVIAVDQDPMGVQGRSLVGVPSAIIKPLIDGSVALALFNTGAVATEIHTDATSIGLSSGYCYAVRDLWEHADSTTHGDLVQTVPAHGVAMLRVSRCR